MKDLVDLPLASCTNHSVSYCQSSVAFSETSGGTTAIICNGKEGILIRMITLPVNYF
jgi:hypothetical protein